MTTRPLSILQTCFSRSWGGLEMQALEMSANLAARGHTVTVAGIPGSRLLAEAHGLATLPLRVTGYAHPGVALGLARFLRERRIHIIHAQLSKDIATVVPAMILSGRRTPLILSKRVGSYITKRDPFHRFTFRYVDRVLAISSVIRQNVIDTTPVAPDAVIVLHDAVDARRFSPTRVDRGAVRRELGYPDDVVLVGFAGRFSPGKGHEEFLQAAATVRRSRPEARFIVVGEASFGEETYERTIRAMSGELGLDDVVRFAGYRGDMPAVMAAFDLFAFPSHAEAFGMVLIEAMAMERAVVSTNCDGVLDIVVDGRTGIYVHPRRADELAAAITRLIDDPGLREAMGKAGRERVLELFDTTHQTDRLEAIYRDLLS